MGTGKPPEGGERRWKWRIKVCKLRKQASDIALLPSDRRRRGREGR